MNREIETRIASWRPSELDAVEVSGTGRSSLGWRSYRSLQYPAFDLLAPGEVSTFDVVICEQVLEHVRDPVAAMATLRSMCRPGGRLVVSVPFLLRVHEEPADLWRFTADGLTELLDRAGLEAVETRTWGNASCVKANLRSWAGFRWHHRALSRWSLRNDSRLPMVVWAYARAPR